MNKFKNSKLRVVLYLRLSDEDRNKLTKEEISESIKNQEIILKKYAKEQNFLVVGVYNDEDYSGTDRDRPNFNKMIKECEQGNVDVVLVKTQARFARDIELIDKYVHNKFKEWNVRFLTLLEKIDNTKKETKKTSQITSMVDEWYVEDTSNNIRETFRAKREAGQFTGSFAPYGYKKDPENKNHLIIDPIPADIIKRIYIEYSKGYSINKIINGLTNDNILSPFEYKKMHNCKLKIPVNKNNYNINSIQKVGSYIISNHFFNNHNQILNNITTIDIITCEDKNFTNKLTIQINKFNQNKTKLYYSLKSLKELNIEMDKQIIFKQIDFNSNDWHPLNINEVLPDNITCIASYTKKLDRKNEIKYEIEVILKENKNHNNFYFKSYVNDMNLSFDTQIRNKYKWSNQTIKKFLKDEVYIGNLLQFKTTYVSYKNHKIIYNDKKDWIRYNNAHEPIIEKNIWNDVQKRLKTRNKACKNGKIHILARKIYCSNCGSVFCKCGRNDDNGMSYLCCKDKNTKWSNCDNNKYIKETELHEFIIEKINNLLDRFYNKKMQIEINNNYIENNLFKNKTDNLKKEKENIYKNLDIKSSYLQSLYEDKKAGLLDNEEYILLKKKYREDYQKLKNRIVNISNEIKIIQKKQEKLKNQKYILNKYNHISNLSIEIVNSLINKIQIGKLDCKTNKRKIKIIWDFTN